MPLVCSFYLAAAYVNQLLNLRSPTDHSVLSDTRRMERHLNHLHLFQQMIFPSRSSCLNYQFQTLRGSQTGTARVELRPFTEIPASQVMSIS